MYVLAYLGAALAVIWGIAHLVATGEWWQASVT